MLHMQAMPWRYTRVRQAVCCAMRRRAADHTPGAHVQEKTLLKASFARATYKGTLLNVAAECGVSASGLELACRSAIVKEKHPALIRHMKGGHTTDALLYLADRLADAKHLYKLFLKAVASARPVNPCPELLDAQQRTAFVDKVLAQHPVLFLVPIADVFLLVKEAEQLFKVASRHKLLRPLAVCLSRGHVVVTQQRLRQQAHLLQQLLPAMSTQQLTNLFLTNPLGLLTVDASLAARGHGALAAALALSMQDAVALGLANSHALRCVVRTAAHAEAAAQLDATMALPSGWGTGSGKSRPNSGGSSMVGGAPGVHSNAGQLSIYSIHGEHSFDVGSIMLSTLRTGSDGSVHFSGSVGQVPSLASAYSQPGAQAPHGSREMGAAVDPLPAVLTDASIQTFLRVRSNLADFLPPLDGDVDGTVSGGGGGSSYGSSCSSTLRSSEQADSNSSCSCSSRTGSQSSPAMSAVLSTPAIGNSKGSSTGKVCVPDTDEPHRSSSSSSSSSSRSGSSSSNVSRCSSAQHMQAAMEQSSLARRYRILHTAAAHASALGNPRWEKSLAKAKAASKSTLLCYSEPRYLRLQYLLMQGGRHVTVAMGSALTYTEAAFVQRFPEFITWAERQYGMAYEDLCLWLRCGGQLEQSSFAPGGSASATAAARDAAATFSFGDASAARQQLLANVVPLGLSARVRRQLWDRQQELQMAVALAPARTSH